MIHARICLSFSHTRTHAHTHTRTHARTHARTHTHTHTHTKPRRGFETLANCLRQGLESGRRARHPLRKQFASDWMRSRSPWNSNIMSKSIHITYTEHFGHTCSSDLFFLLTYLSRQYVPKLPELSFDWCLSLSVLRSRACTNTPSNFTCAHRGLFHNLSLSSEQEVSAKYNLTLSDELAIQAKRFFVRFLYDVTNFILRDALCTFIC
jgi:hypothetical protein